jgi:hypothetical protein
MSEPSPANAPSISRRSMLKTMGAGVGAATLVPWLSDEAALAFAEIQQKGTAPALKVLTQPQFASLEALVETIIPADERSPGAKEARVAEYVDLLLSEAEENVKQEWLQGLGALDAEAQARFSAPFARLAAAQAEQLLGDLARNENTPKTPLETFFKTTKNATIHGYYTSEIGIHKELRYQGRKILQEYVGCQTVDGKDCPHCGQKAVV